MRDLAARFAIQVCEVEGVASGMTWERVQVLFGQMILLREMEEDQEKAEEAINKWVDGLEDLKDLVMVGVIRGWIVDMKVGGGTMLVRGIKEMHECVMKGLGRREGEFSKYDRVTWFDDQLHVYASPTKVTGLMTELVNDIERREEKRGGWCALKCQKSWNDV